MYNYNPLDQFEIRDLISLNLPIINNISISLTNITLYILLASVITLYSNLYTNNEMKLVPST